MKILFSLIKLENKLSLIQALKINTIWRVTRFQSKIYKRVIGLQEWKDYKSLSEGKGELSWIWELKLKILTWKLGPGNLDPSPVFRVCQFIDEVNPGKFSKVTWVGWVNLSYSVDRIL